MKKVLFFTQDQWAFGSIHRALNKVLYKEGIYCNLLPWNTPYRVEEFKMLNKIYDVFVSHPEAVSVLKNDYGIPLEKIIVIAHGQWDILHAKEKTTFDLYSELKGFGVISEVLKSKCMEWGIPTIPDVVELGIHFDLFYSTPSKKLSIVGYAGANETLNYFGKEIKRLNLIPVITNGIEDIEYRRHDFFHYFCMPAYYKEIDCLIMPSIEEAGGLPIMEAAAAGRLTMGTPVGYFEHNARKGGGVLLPLEENEFVQSAKKNIIFYRDNPQEYQRRCLEIQEFARYNYDWSYKVDDWVKLLSK